MEYLSNKELYFTERVNGNAVIIEGDDFRHIVKVMRHQKNDHIYVTSGKGIIHKCTINEIAKEYILAESIKEFRFDNPLGNITFCIPLLKNTDRMEFALEKSIELGISNFIFFKAERSNAYSAKLERLNKIAIAALKQSLLSYKPNLTFNEKLTNVTNPIILEQESAEKINLYDFNTDKKYHFIFGPEGGLSEREINSFTDAKVLSLTKNRLRSETAIITTASILSLK